MKTALSFCLLTLLAFVQTSAYADPDLKKETLNLQALPEGDGLWVAVFWPSGILLPLGRIQNERWDACWPQVEDKTNPAMRPPKNWFIHGAIAKVPVKKAHHLSFTCESAAWGFQAPSHDGTAPTIVLSGISTDLVDRSQKGWNEGKELISDQSDQSFEYVELLGRYRLKDGILAVRHHTYYESGEIEIEWAPAKGPKTLFKYWLGGC